MILFRRWVQGLSLLLFLVLFFYVCCPYTGTPQNVNNRMCFYPPTNVGGSQNPALTLGATDLTDTVPVDNDMFGDELDSLESSFSPSPFSPVPEEEPDFPDHYSVLLQQKSVVPPYLFLAVDPSVAVTTLVTGTSPPNSVLWYYCGGILFLSFVFARCFCGYLCPMGTVIDMADWITASVPFYGKLAPSVSAGFSRSSPALTLGAKHPLRDVLRHLRFGVLVVLVSAASLGTVLTGYVSPIPLLTRNVGFLFSPLQTAWYRDWGQVPPVGFAAGLSVFLFVAILAAGIYTPRFFCRFICPSGAIFSLMNFFGAIFSQRIVQDKCIHCGKCVHSCHFDAIATSEHAIVKTGHSDGVPSPFPAAMKTSVSPHLRYTTVGSHCTSCQTCAAVCPTAAIRYGVREKGTPTAVFYENGLNENTPSSETGDMDKVRRYVLQSMTYGGFALLGVTSATVTGRCSRVDGARAATLIRPPGSVAEKQFLQLCSRCGECFRACPNDALQPCSLESGLDSLWTPRLAADWSGCEPSCNNCGHVCPTGAIQSLSLEEKRRFVMGIAVVNRLTCLPYCGKEDCTLCYDECKRAGYNAIEFIQVHTEMDTDGTPMEGTGYTAPVILKEKCIGCGLCQARCHAIQVKTGKKLEQSAVVVER